MGYYSDLTALEEGICCGVKTVPEDAIFALQRAFNKDERAHKVNLGIGVYQKEGKGVLFESVRLAEEMRSFSPHGYLPIAGHADFLSQVQSLLFEPFSREEKASSLFGLQTIGGTGALSLFAAFAHSALNAKRIYLPQLTWPNHVSIFQGMGLSIEQYPYERDWYPHEKVCQKMKTLDKGSIVLFHACCHNPTGLDPSREEWAELAEIVRERQLFPLFDCAYQGLGIDVDYDVYPIRHFAERGIELAVAYSCSKNFGFYGQRVGALFVFLRKKEHCAAARSELCSKIRSFYSNPPAYGASLVAAILSSKELKAVWKRELEQMRQQLTAMREKMTETFPFSSNHLAMGRGMFSLLALSPSDVALLQKEHALYLLSNGRVNVAGMSEGNFEQVCTALRAFLK